MQLWMVLHGWWFLCVLFWGGSFVGKALLGSFSSPSLSTECLAISSLSNSRKWRTWGSFIDAFPETDLCCSEDFSLALFCSYCFMFEDLPSSVVTFGLNLMALKRLIRLIKDRTPVKKKLVKSIWWSWWCSSAKWHEISVDQAKQTFWKSCNGNICWWITTV